MHVIHKKTTLIPSEISAIERLIDMCNTHDSLHMRIEKSMLCERPGNMVNDYLYYEDGQLVGYLSADSWGKKDKEITGMVHPDYRRRGIGRALFEAAREEYKRNGVQMLIFVCEHASQSGRAFLETTGAEHAYSEHYMVLGNFKERGQVKEGLEMRLATESDIPAITTILATDTGNVEEVKAWVTDAMKDPHQRTYFATLHGKPLGCVRLDFMEKVTGIYGFEVRLGYRGLGYGRQMLEQLISIARAESDRPVILEVLTDNTNAIGLYHSVGFEIRTTYDYYELPLLLRQATDKPFACHSERSEESTSSRAEILRFAQNDNEAAQ